MLIESAIESSEWWSSFLPKDVLWNTVLLPTAASASASWHPKNEVRLGKDGRFLESKAQQDCIIKYLQRQQNRSKTGNLNEAKWVTFHLTKHRLLLWSDLFMACLSWGKYCPRLRIHIRKDKLDDAFGQIQCGPEFRRRVPQVKTETQKKVQLCSEIPETKRKNFFFFS